MSYSPRFKDKYDKEVIPALKKQFEYKNNMEVPHLIKISLNQGLGTAIADKKMIDTAVNEMTAISGQKPWQPNQEKIYQTSNFVKACPSESGLPSEAIKCTNSSTD